MTGVIKTLKTGFGFIHATDGKDYFFHRSNLIDIHFGELIEGTKVKFEVDTMNDSKGPRACDVRLLGD